jgi:hypothetical protein
VPGSAARAKRISAERECEPGFLHVRGAMVLDRTLADAEVGGNVLAGWPASISSMIWRWRGSNRRGASLRPPAEPKTWRNPECLFQGMLDAGEGSSTPIRPAKMSPISYRRHRFPPVVIQHAIWLHLRFILSYCDVEELLAGVSARNFLRDGSQLGGEIRTDHRTTATAVPFSAERSLAS